MMTTASESKGTYYTIIESIRATGGFKGTKLEVAKLGPCPATVDRCYISLDAKGAAMVYHCNAAQSSDDFCPYHCPDLHKLSGFNKKKGKHEIGYVLIFLIIIIL